MANDVTNPEAFSMTKPAAAFAHIDPAAEDLSEGIGSSYGIIGYKGKVWTLRYRGEKYTFTSKMADGSLVTSNSIDVIIVGQAKGKSKSYYAAYDQNQSEGQRPICASLDGVVPDPDVQQKQSETCALCPRNVWKVDANGRKGRECSDYKRLAVLILPAQSAVLMGGAPLMESVFLRVPPASLNNLAVMGERMSRQGWAPITYITKISFDSPLPHPQLIFQEVRGLKDAEAAIVLPFYTDPQTLRIIGADQDRKVLAAPVSPPAAALPPTAAPAPVAFAPPPAPQPAPVAFAPPPAPQPAPVAFAPPPAPMVAALPTVAVTATPLATEIKLPPPNAPATPPQGVRVDEINTGFASPASLTLAPTPGSGPPKPAIITGQVTAPAAQTAADTGEAEFSDAALDARIAVLMPKK
jgi:hypothetical protein